MWSTVALNGISGKLVSVYTIVINDVLFSYVLSIPRNLLLMQ